MSDVSVELGERRYEIVIEAGAIYQLGERMAALGLTDRALIITNPAINALYGEQTRRSLAEADIRSEVIELPEGEEHKDLRTIVAAYDYLIEHNYSRSATIVALGGGVIGDMAGFIASTYMRGVPYVQVPTTLLAMVDSSVGGKTGVNHRLAKNMIGAFYQPRLVVADLETLRSLSPAEFRAGYAEVIKYGVIWDADMFAFLEKSLDQVFALDYDALSHVVRRSCEIKAEVVATDEREAGLRAILNYGHTFGHSLEAITNYASYRHGEAVAIGMVAAARMAVQLDMLDEKESVRLEHHLATAGLPILFPAIDVREMLERFSKDKKALRGVVRFVLPERIGKVILRDDIPVELSRQVIEAMIV